MTACGSCALPCDALGFQSRADVIHAADASYTVRCVLPSARHYICSAHCSRTHRKDSASFVKQGQQVVRQCDAPNQGQVPVCNLNEGLGRPRTLLLRHQPCMQVDML